MRKAFGIVDLLIALLVIGVAFALMNSKNPIVKEHERVNVQKQQADEMIEHVKQLRQQNAIENVEMLNSIGE